MWSNSDSGNVVEVPVEDDYFAWACFDASPSEFPEILTLVK